MKISDKESEEEAFVSMKRDTTPAIGKNKSYYKINFDLN